MDRWADLEPGERGPARLADLLFALSREVEPHGRNGVDVIALSNLEVAVLRWIDGHPGTSPSATAQATGLQRSNLSAALRGLESKGMLARSPDPSDHRLIRLRLTGVAHENIQRLHRHWAGLVGAALGGDERGLAQTLDLLERLHAGLLRTPGSSDPDDSDNRP